MLGLFSSKPQGVQVGVDFTPTGVAVVDVITRRKERGAVRRSAFLPAVGAKQQADVLRHWVEQNGLKKAPCIGLVASHDVQIFQLEKPAVEDSELMQAVSWKIKDLINYDVATAVVDVYEMPVSPKSPVKYINAVVANESVIGSYVERIKNSGLELSALDVHDLVGRNFQILESDSEQTSALLQLSDKQGLITIYRGQDLYVARDFKIGLLDIEGSQEEVESQYDNLLLELQRSFDYFEATYGLAAVQHMTLFPQTVAVEKMLKYLQNYVAYELDFAHINSQSEQKALDLHCFSAYCAALRGVAQ